ncbi:MAG: T9SS type A sorting domain-containing protein [Calditrichaeota bacterium]|nr:T9SS type A sorting domain-containing protein [Calditrichota bacterium]
MLANDPEGADAIRASAWFANYFEVIRLTDGNSAYLMLREVLNDNYFDDNGTPDDATDDVRGSFDLGWGLLVVKVNALHPAVAVQVVHPSTDFISPHVALDAFLTLDAGTLMVSGVSRNAAWSGQTYDSDSSLSDPSRNGRTALQEWNLAMLSARPGTWSIQVHSYNAYNSNGTPAHVGVNSVQLSWERENRADPNLPMMSWDHNDLISLTPDPAVPQSEAWPFAAVGIGSYYTAYYPGNYKWRGQTTIPNNVDLPGTASNCQMVASHVGHHFTYDLENWLHMELDEFPDVAAATGMSIAEFYGYTGPGSGVPTWRNFQAVVHYYRPIFTAARAWLDQAPAVPSLVQESASFDNFYMGSTAGATAYDNWVSHISEGIAQAGYNDHGPAQLDRQTNGFGRFEVINSEIGGDVVLKVLKEASRRLVTGDEAGVRYLLRNAGLGTRYQLVRLTDGDATYLILREVLNNNYFDDNGTETAADDVQGSFDLGWGLFAVRLDAPRAQIIIEAPHPCDDYVSPALALDAFHTLGAGVLMVNGAGREVAWTGVTPYTNSKSLSDPTRNGRTWFNVMHQAAVDLLDQELTIQVHSYDSDGHPNSRCGEISAADDYYPNAPLMDAGTHFDLVSLTPLYPVPANSIGAGNHAAVRVDDYYGVYYGGGYRWNNDNNIVISNYIEQPGFGSNQQMLYSHAGHNAQSDPENWLHFELDEFPNVITENIISFYGGADAVPTFADFTNEVQFFHPIFDALERYFQGPGEQVLTIAPSSEQTIIGTRQGSLAEVSASDNGYEVLTEVVSGGQPARRYSYLEHIWTFSLTGYDLSLAVEAFHNSNNENDHFVFAGSFDGQNYTELLTVTKVADDNTPQVVAINGSATGSFYLRVRDTDRTQGRTGLDRLSVDHLALTYTVGEAPADQYMAVAGIALSSRVVKRNTTVTGIVTIQSENDNPVPGAVVSARWSGIYSANVNGTTDGNGQVSFVTPQIRDASGDIVLTVLDVVKEGLTYDPNLNAVSSATLRVGNQGGSIATGPDMPQVYAIGSAFPNPFNASVNLQVALPEAALFHLALYDMQGRRVATLLEGVRPAGWHRAVWTAGTSPAGNYVVVLRAGERIRATQVITLTK